MCIHLCPFPLQQTTLEMQCLLRWCITCCPHAVLSMKTYAHSMRTAQHEDNLLCAVHAELKLCLKNEAIMAFAAFEEINVLLLEISVTSSISNMNSHVQC